MDLVWPAEERPAYPEDPVYIHELHFAGEWQGLFSVLQYCSLYACCTRILTFSHLILFLVIFN